MIDLVKIKATNLLRVTFLVLDEADRMFDMGFGEHRNWIFLMIFGWQNMFDFLFVQNPRCGQFATMFAPSDKLCSFLQHLKRGLKN